MTFIVTKDITFLTVRKNRMNLGKENEQIVLKEISNNSKVTRDSLSSKTGRSSRHI